MRIFVLLLVLWGAMAIYGYLMGIDRDMTSNFNEMGVSENG